MTTGSDDPRQYGDSFADIYDDWYGDLEPVDTMVGALRRVSPGPRLLELGIGTGRIALPLVAAGFAVVGIDASLPMLKVLAANSSQHGDAPAAIGADMAHIPLRPESFDVALIAYNTFFNLVAPGAQESCLLDITNVLRPGGRLVLDTFIAEEPPSTRHHAVSRARRSADEVVLIATRQDGRSHRVDGVHLQFTPAGLTARPWAIRPQSPDVLDEMAATAGLRLAGRSSDWAGTPFDPAFGRQVSIYEKPIIQPRPPGGGLLP